MALISFVIPVFQNAGSLKTTYSVISNYIQSLGHDLEIVFVNDGSSDSSEEELQSIFEIDKRLKVLSFSRNFGQVAAVTAGFKEVTGDVAVMMSADLQDPIEKVGEMIERWKAGAGIVICHRHTREDSLFARLTSSFFYKLIKLASPNMPEGGFDFLLLDKQVVSEFNKLDERNRFFQGDILWLGFNVSFIPYNRIARKIGKSQWSLSKKVKYFIDGLLNTSYIPIRLMALLGIITSFSGFLYAFIIVYARLFHKVPFSGWAPIMILILIIGGIIMLMLGIIGEYLWRTYDETRKRPLFIIKKRLEH